MSAASPGQTPYYFVPAPSRHPALAALGLFFVILGAGQWVNGFDWGMYALFFGLALWLFVLQQWFRQSIGESVAKAMKARSATKTNSAARRSETGTQPVAA